MPNQILQSIIEKVSQTIRDFFKKEEEIEKAGEQIVKEAIKESDEKKIAEIKSKIEKIN